MAIKIKAKLFWAQLNETNEMSGKYQVDLANLSPEAVKELSTLGIKVNKRDDDQYDRGHYITCKSTLPIKATDSNGVPIATDIRIGNGSDAVAVVASYDWEFKGKKGTSPTLNTLIINNLIEYESSDSIPEGVAV
jgi:hypothetical protein